MVVSYSFLPALTYFASSAYWACVDVVTVSCVYITDKQVSVCLICVYVSDVSYLKIADQQASMFGQCCFDVGDINITLGTGTFLDINTGQNPHASVAG